MVEMYEKGEKPSLKLKDNKQASTPITQNILKLRGSDEEEDKKMLE